MPSNDHGQVSTIVRRLGELASLLNPVELARVVRETLTEIAEPPPGDPDALESLARAYHTAAQATTPIGEDVAKVGTEHLPASWKGGAATDAAAVISATAKEVGRTPGVFLEAADALTELAGAVREQQRTHAELHQALHDAVHDATHVLGLPIPDPTALDDVVRAVHRVLHGCIAVYTASLTSADRAAERFADLAGQARAARAVQGGLAADDAVVLAEEMVSLLGGADGYDDGILTDAQLLDAGRRLDALSAQDRKAFADLLARAGSDTERAWLLKGLAAGHGVSDVTAFAAAIRGKDATWLDEHLSLIDRGGPGSQYRLGGDVRQFEETTCGTTVLIVARAEADPLYALSMTGGDDFAARFAAERDQVHDDTNAIWPKALGTTPMGMVDYLNDHADATGAHYDWHVVDDTDQRGISATMRDVVGAVDGGHPVPLVVGDGIPRHYVLVVGHSGDDMLVYEPGGGATVRVPEADFMNGKLGDGGGGWPNVQAVVTPTG